MPGGESESYESYESYSSEEADAVSDEDDILVSRKKATELTRELREFMQNPAGAPTDTNNIFEWCRFFETAIKWAQLYLSPRPVADSGVRKFATLVAQTIRRINIQFPTEFTLVMATDNRVFVSEILWNAYARVNVVASEYVWIRDFGRTTPMDPAFFSINLFMNNIPFVRMSMTEYYANLTRICADWKKLDFSPELRTYMELMEARACMFIAHAYSEYVTDHRIYRSLARGARGNVTLEDIRAAIERKRREEEIRERKANIIEGALDMSAADAALMQGGAEGSSGDGVGREMMVNVNRVGTDGAIHIDVQDSGKSSFRGMRRADELERAASSLQAALASSAASGGEKLESAIKQWEHMTHTEYAAFRFLNENKALHLQMLRKTGRPLMTMVSNFHFVHETYAIFSEMTRDVMEHTRFKRSLVIDDLGAIAAGFSMFTRDDIECAYANFCGYMDMAIEGISEARWEERITKMYFETCMHVGERARHLRLQKDADPAAHSVIHASNAARFNTVSVAAQRCVLDMWKDEAETPVFVREMIEMYALDFRFLEHTKGNFTDTFSCAGAQVRLADAPAYPIVVTTFGRHRVYDNGVLITFRPFRLAIMFWMLRCMFDPAMRGIVAGVTIRELFHQMFPNLTGHVGRFLSDAVRPPETARQHKRRRRRRRRRRRSDGSSGSSSSDASSSSGSSSRRRKKK